jgi:formylglycine-generating enzyme required for sulfatase activity
LFIVGFLAVGCSTPARAGPGEKDGKTAGRKVTNSLGMVLMRVPAGAFLMGATDADDLARKDEKPQHKVRIGHSYYLGAHEVTVAQFRVFVKESGFKSAAESDGKGSSGYNADWRGFEYNSARYSWQNPGYAQGENHPVVNVNWHDAQAFCAWLSQKEGRRYRLPTEAEWEYACRAGTTTRFTTGTSPADLKPVANLGDQALAKKWDTSTVKKYGLDPKVITFQPWDDGYPFTAPVGSYKANAFGLHDMLGNVGEFCSDWYQSDYYREAPELNPKGPAKDRPGHVVRGGTFLNGPSLVRATSRVECEDAYRNYVIGFRVLLEAS